MDIFGTITSVRNADNERLILCAETSALAALLNIQGTEFQIQGIGLDSFKLVYSQLLKMLLGAAVYRLEVESATTCIE